MSKNKKVSYKSLRKLLQVREHTGICEFHYYPEDSEYSTISPYIVDEIFHQLSENETDLVRYKDRIYCVKNVEVFDSFGLPLVGLVQIAPPKALRV